MDGRNPVNESSESQLTAGELRSRLKCDGAEMAPLQTCAATLLSMKLPSLMDCCLLLFHLKATIVIWRGRCSLLQMQRDWQLDLLTCQYLLLSSMVLAFTYSALTEDLPHFSPAETRGLTGDYYLSTRSMIIVFCMCTFSSVLNSDYMGDSAVGLSSTALTGLDIALGWILQAAPLCGACEISLRLFNFGRGRATEVLENKRASDAHGKRVSIAHQMLRTSGLLVWYLGTAGSILSPVAGLQFREPASFVVSTSALHFVSGFAWLLVTQASFSPFADARRASLCILGAAWAGVAGRCGDRLFATTFMHAFLLVSGASKCFPHADS